MTQFKHAFALMLGVSALTVAASGSANALPDELGSQLYNKPGEFQLLDRIDRKVVDFPTARKVKVCMDVQHSDLTPLDEFQAQKIKGVEIKTAAGIRTVTPGKCVTVDAKRIMVRSDGAIPGNWELQGKISKRS